MIKFSIDVWHDGEAAILTRAIEEILAMRSKRDEEERAEEYAKNKIHHPEPMGKVDAEPEVVAIPRKASKSTKRDAQKALQDKHAAAKAAVAVDPTTVPDATTPGAATRDASAAPSASTPSEGLTQSDVEKALRRLIEDQGMEAGHKVLAKFSLRRFVDLKPEQYKDAMGLIENMAAKSGAGSGAI